MPRSVPKVASRNRRKKLLKKTRGYFGARGNVHTVAKNTYEKGLQYAFRDRKAKKREMRALWILRLGAAGRQHGVPYHSLIPALNRSRIELNRKVLADIAATEPYSFRAVMDTIRHSS